MLRYLSRRILLFIPTLFIVSAATFFLSKMAPGDVVSAKFQGNFTEAEYIRAAKQAGLGKPNFYFTLTTQAYPDTFHQIVYPDKKEVLDFLIGKYGNWEGVNQYFQSLELLKKGIEKKLNSGAVQNELGVLSRQLFLQKKEAKIAEKLNELGRVIQKDSIARAVLFAEFSGVERAFTLLKRSATPTNHLLPNFIWHGTENQYHTWISNFVTGDFGTSYRTGESVSKRVKEAVFWTFILNSIAIFLAFGIGIPLGVRAAAKEGSRFDKNANFILYALFSMPGFWVGTMLLVFFCTPEYGMKLFPSGGLGAPSGNFSSTWALISARSYHLVLPIICITYPSVAYIFRQMRGSMITELKKNYIRTARAKGLSERQVIWKHAFPNALFPIITMVANILPALISGSIAIEVVFSLPGMGKLMIESIASSEWSLVYAIMMFGAILTILGVLLSDVLYAWLDPRIRF